MTKKRTKSGFTMVELVVVMLIISIILAIAIPSLGGYIHRSQVRRNNSYAKTLYLSAEYNLTYYRTSGQWQDFQRQILAFGTPNPDNRGDGTEFDRIYSISMEKGEYYNETLKEDAALVSKLLQGVTLEKSVLGGAVTIEIDVESGQVYSAFYGEHCNGFAYDSAGKENFYDMSDRDYDSRYPKRIGYYSVDDLVNVVDLELSRMKITSISLLNTETLTLNWESNSRHDNLDILYDIKIYNDKTKAELISFEFERAELVPGMDSGSVILQISNQGFAPKAYAFPISYVDGRFSLTLDAMMTSELVGALADAPAASDMSSTSITRFGGVFSQPLSIYATVQAKPTYKNVGGEIREYKESPITDSNVSNTLFGDESQDGEFEIATFRHLSNIRYASEAKSFRLTKRAIDYNSDSVVLYKAAGVRGLAAVTGKNAGFPVIPQLAKDQRLVGSGTVLGLFSTGNYIRNLRLDESSLYEGQTLLGLFGQNHGEISSIYFEDAVVRCVNENVTAVGVVCGVNDGVLDSITVEGNTSIDADIKSSAGPIGVGGIAGILDAAFPVSGASYPKAQNLVVEGTIKASLSDAAANLSTEGGIGGIFGYAVFDDGQYITKCANRADVTGDLCVGGVVGYAKGNASTITSESSSNLLNCTNEGLVLTAMNYGYDSTNRGCFAGGILGYGVKVLIENCNSTAGRSGDFVYTADKTHYLKGNYIGGILGFGDSCLVLDCATGSGGYILGNDYVGGIVGGLTGHKENVIQTESASVTRNASYVIGNSYVGGIVGENRGNSTIVNCENTGVVAGYDKYIGGICGYNASDETGTALVKHCSSYISDIGNTRYDLVTGWETLGDCVGGLVGYNSGKILFSEELGNTTTSKSVSSIVVGENYIGGLVGFNDVSGDIQIDYELLSGRVHATGNCAGGLIGLNASEALLKHELTIKSIGVKGNYFVGGAIGANVVDLSDDTVMDKIRVNNTLASVSAKAFCGGVMGYHRTYETSQLGDYQSLFEYLDANGMYGLLPEVDTAYGNTPKAVIKTQNPHRLTITDAENTESLNKATNDMGIRAYAYFGGIMGYADPDSALVLKNCYNAGGFTMPSTEDIPADDPIAMGVDVCKYLERGGYTQAADNLSELLGGQSMSVSIVGGVMGVTGRLHVIDNCKNTGPMNGLTSLGGVVGLNNGGVFRCTLNGNLGSSTQNYVGGIVGLNIGPKAGDTVQSYDIYTYTMGTVKDCETSDGYTVTGRNVVGGIVGYNMYGGVVEANKSNANVNGADSVGGLVGANAGLVSLSDKSGTESRAVNSSGKGVGGIIGLNTEFGVLKAHGSGEIVVTDEKLTVDGQEYVGGIVGINFGSFEADGTAYLINMANSVRARKGYAGGIAGSQEGNSRVLSHAKNKGRIVSADMGPAGGIVAVNKAGNTIENCVNMGDVTGNDGYAGGVVSLNYGTVRNCSVSGGGTADVETTVDIPYVTSVTAVCDDHGNISTSTTCKINSAAGLGNILSSTGNVTFTSSNRISNDYITVSIRFSERVEVTKLTSYLSGVGRAEVKAADGSYERFGNTFSRQNQNTQNITFNDTYTTDEIRIVFTGGYSNYNTTGRRTAKIGATVISFNHNGKSYTMTDALRQETTVVSGVRIPISITSRGVDEIGAVCAVNYEGGIVRQCTASDSVDLEGSAYVVGAVVGANKGLITNCTVDRLPYYLVNASRMTVGGAVGLNESSVTDITVKASFKDFTNYRYLGGVVGHNKNGANIQGCTYGGEITEERSSAGNCYGGIAGLNDGILNNCTVSQLNMTVTGVYTATSTSTAQQKEKLSTHIGGIAGKNTSYGTISECYISDTSTGSITADNGMVGGVAGYNVGKIILSGDNSTKAYMRGVDSVEMLLSNASDLVAAAYNYDDKYVTWSGSAQLENLSYSTGTAIADGCSMTIIVKSKGNLGGITGYNAPQGTLDKCASGDWLLVNKSEGIGYGTGGIIGMNEGEKDISFLLNRAFVGRQISQGETNRFAGGIIGNQANSTTHNWTINGCVNFGMVYCYRTHYSGGIIGQWTYNGGTIIDCYNYAPLQTTHQAGWVGAAAGIVAQLYHPSSNQDFNIISCQNHGSVYGYNGLSYSQCANDSAGILGNITTYGVTSGMGQIFTINVVDCVNGSGVKIYSNSMASGLVGFFSSDKTSYIANSTQNIILNIDRCRNYAEALNAGSYRGGFLGDRYGNNALSTYIQNCFTAYNDNNFPCISLSLGNSIPLSSENVGNNYYFRETNAVSDAFAVSETGTPTGNVYLGNATEHTLTNARMARFGALSAPYNGNDYFFMCVGPQPDTPGGKGAATTNSVELYNGFDSGLSYIRNNRIYSRVNNTITEVGDVLFYLPRTYTLNQIRTSAPEFDTYVKEAYRRFETVADGAIKAPDSVMLQDLTDGSFNVVITNSDRPLYYEAHLMVDGEVIQSGLKFLPREKAYDGVYTTTGNFRITAASGEGTPVLRVRAVSMYDGIAPSQWVDTDVLTDKVLLPAPDVVGQLVNEGGYTYKYSLKNIADFQNPIYASWNVSISMLGGGSLTLSADSPAGNMSGQGLQQMTVQALGGNNLVSSEVLNISTSTPENGRPEASLNDVVLELDGDTIETLAATVNITVNEANITTPPIYRVELVGTYNGKETVFAYDEVLVAAGSQVKAEFYGISRKLFEATDKKVRVWYSSSGLGPVYTYRETDDESAADVAVLNADDTYTYLESTVLANRLDFANHIREITLPLDALPAPALYDAERLTPTITDGKLMYTFSWDEGKIGADYANARYSVQLIGITDSDIEITVLTDEAYADNTQRSFTIDAENWNYKTVRLKVTRIGNVENGLLGLDSTAEYKVSKRLAQAGQPAVENSDVNELKYSVAWSAITDEYGCIGYEVYARPQNSTSQVLLASVGSGQLCYSETADLEAFAGQNVAIYVVAKADPDELDYQDSPMGVSYSLNVPKRLDTPSVDWSFNWTYNKDNPVEASDFANGRLVVMAKPRDDLSKPPGGSTYLLSYTVYEYDDSVLAEYPPVPMEDNGDGCFSAGISHVSADYAGKKIIFAVRTSYGNGMVSSLWSNGEQRQLPYIKLAKPQTEISYTSLPLDVRLSTTPNLLGELSSWTADYMSITWSTVESADLYRLALTELGTEKYINIKPFDDNFSLEVQDTNGNILDSFTFDENGQCILSSTDSETKSYYSAGIPYYYTYSLTTSIKREALENGGFTYTLYIPNVSTLHTQKGEGINLNNVSVSGVSVISNVLENLDVASPSMAYIASEPAIHTFG